MSSNTELALDSLLDIFSNQVRTREEILYDGDKEYAVIYSADTPQDRAHAIFTYMDIHAALDAATTNLACEDGWEPLYAVELTTGRWWRVETRASLGEEGSIA